VFGLQKHLLANAIIISKQNAFVNKNFNIFGKILIYLSVGVFQSKSNYCRMNILYGY